MVDSVKGSSGVSGKGSAPGRSGKVERKGAAAPSHDYIEEKRAIEVIEDLKSLRDMDLSEEKTEERAKKSRKILEDNKELTLSSDHTRMGDVV